MSEREVGPIRDAPRSSVPSAIGDVGAGGEAARQPVAPPKAHGGGGSGEPRRRSGDRRQAGFQDGIERVACAAMRAVPPPDFPVQHRTGVATMPSRAVDRTPGFVLLCDGTHPGDHQWPFDATLAIAADTADASPGQKPDQSRS